MDTYGIYSIVMCYTRLYDHQYMKERGWKCDVIILQYRNLDFSALWMDVSFAHQSEKKIDGLFHHHPYIASSFGWVSNRIQPAAQWHSYNTAVQQTYMDSQTPAAHS